ncbi:MAG: hypothetical protein V4568_06295 [Pseudomonadota bacterium]
MQPAVNEVPMVDDSREEYTPPDIHDLGDVSAITKSDGCNVSSDGGYS